MNANAGFVKRIRRLTALLLLGGGGGGKSTHSCLCQYICRHCRSELTIVSLNHCGTIAHLLRKRV